MKNSNEMIALCEKFLAMPWENQGFYENYLAQSYYYIFHSTKLLAWAAAHTRRDEKNYYRRLISHIKEEEGHEILAERDLKRLGKNIEDYSENGLTCALYEPQYYKVSKSSTSLLGYVLALECVAVNTFKPLYERTREIYGDKSTTFIRVHAEEDPDHVEKALMEIEQLTREERELVIKNYYQTIDSFLVMMNSCVPK